MNFCLGETAEVRNLFVAAGFNSQGIIYSPGAGRALAEWIREGAPTFDASEVEVRRFASSQANGRYLHERTREALGRLYAMRTGPTWRPPTARGIRRSPLYDRLTAAGACFGELAQWERPMWFAPPGVEPVYEYSFGRQNWFPYAAETSRRPRGRGTLRPELVRQDRGDGSGRLPAAPHVCTNDVDVAVGRLVYTLFLNQRGGSRTTGRSRDWTPTGSSCSRRRSGSIAPSSGCAPTAETCLRRRPTSPAASPRWP